MSVMQYSNRTYADGAGNGDGSSAAGAGSSAMQIKTRTGTTTNGLYWIKPPNGPAEQVYCDMNTQGGGWMLIARTHPSMSMASGTWGWNSTTLAGSAAANSAGYHLGIRRLWNAGLRFYSFLYGNQLSQTSNEWGPFVYQVANYQSEDFMNLDNPYGGERSLVKFDFSIYNSGLQNGMQQTNGFALTGTSQNLFSMRDVPISAVYGIAPTGMVTTYCGTVTSDGQYFYSGPFCNGATLSGDTWVQGGNSTPQTTGGTNQVLLMVR